MTKESAQGAGGRGEVVRAKVELRPTGPLYSEGFATTVSRERNLDVLLMQRHPNGDVVHWSAHQTLTLEKRVRFPSLPHSNDFRGLAASLRSFCPFFFPPFFFLFATKDSPVPPPPSAHYERLTEIANKRLPE